jgi:hypothetical protein
MYDSMESYILYSLSIMSAVATKKPGADRGVALTFPLNFQKAFTGGIAFYPSEDHPPFELMIGTNFQSSYHEQKRIEANQSVMNGIQNRLAAERKLLTGPHNFHLPKPVLGQRKYANPSYGAESFSSTRRDNGREAPFRTVEVGEEGVGMRGGVLTTMEGQTFYNNKLRGRIGELNRINALAVGIPVPMGQEMETFDNTKNGSASKVDFFLFLRALTDSVMDNDLTRFTFENMREMIKRLIAFGPTATPEDFNDIFHSVDLMEDPLDNLTTEDDPERKKFTSAEAATTMLLLVDRIRRYSAEMFRNVYLSEKDKRTLSASLVKSFGLDQFLRKPTPKAVLEEARKTNRRVDQAVEDFDDDFDEDDDDDDDGQPFIRGPTREDTEQGGAPRAPLAGANGDPSRDRFGARNGMVVEDGPVQSFFGEAKAKDAEVPMAAPLALAGFDPAAQAPPQDRSILRQTLEYVMKQIIDPLKVEGDEEKTPEELVTDKYPRPERFVSEVSDAMEERGFTPAQIADAMSQLNIPFFADYIATHTGPIEPAAAAPARLPDPLGFMPPPPGFGPGGEPVAPAPKKFKPRRPKTEGAEGNWKIPSNMSSRAELRNNYRTIASIRALGATIPAYLGGPYKPRSDTMLKNAITRIINIVKKIDPNY